MTSRRHLDVIYAGDDHRHYAVIQRFIGESPAIWATVQWLRDPRALLGSSPPATPTLWLLGDSTPPEVLRAVWQWLVQHELTGAAAILLASADADGIAALQALHGVRLLRIERLTPAAFETLLVQALRERSARRRRRRVT